MDLHKNARLSLRSREALVRKVCEEKVTLKAAAVAFSVSRKTAAKWVSRYRRDPEEPLLDRSSRPHRCPRATSALLVDQVLQSRLEHRPGYLIARDTGLSAATVSRILRRAHLSRWRDLHPLPPVVRYEHPHPGDLLHLDIKGLPQFQQVSMRGDGRRRGMRRHPGRKALHVAIDDHSRLAFSQLLPDQTTETTLAFLRHALAFYAQHGIRVRALLTDNGSSYRSHRFRHECARLGLKHRRTRPYTPRTNGKAERFIQTALREWVYAQHWDDSDQRDAHLPAWLDYYNLARPHGSLGYAPPISRASSVGTTS
jgi:transposase InsO family protein/transposase-like protein